MQYRLSDFTLAGWLLLITFPPVGIVSALYLGQLLLWVFGRQQMEIPHAVLALPGLAYWALYWGACQWLGIRLMKPNRGYDSGTVPWKTIGVIAVCTVGPFVLLFLFLVVYRLFHPIN